MRWLWIAAAVCGCYDVVPRGTLRGVVTDAATGEPLAGVTVVVTSGPEEEQGELTDEKGVYVIDEIPAGRVIVRFYFGNAKVEAIADIDEHATAHLETQISVAKLDEADDISFSGATDLENNYIIDY